MTDTNETPRIKRQKEEEKEEKRRREEKTANEGRCTTCI